MKFRNLFLAIIAALGLISCEKEDNVLRGIVTYELVKPDVFYYFASGTRTDVFSNVFLVTVTYKNAQGEMITEEDVTLPWEKQFEVEAPFTASITQTLTVNPQAELNPPLEFPETNSKNLLAKISVASNGKEISEDGAVTGGAGRLWQNIDSWMAANGTKTVTLLFTEEYFNKNAYSK